MDLPTCKVFLMLYKRTQHSWGIWLWLVAAKEFFNISIIGHPLFHTCSYEQNVWLHKIWTSMLWWKHQNFSKTAMNLCFLCCFFIKNHLILLLIFTNVWYGRLKLLFTCMMVSVIYEGSLMEALVMAKVELRLISQSPTSKHKVCC